MKNFIKLLLPGYRISKKIWIRYRIAKYFSDKRLKFLANWFKYRLYRKYHCCISPRANIGKKILCPHPIGIVIGDGVVIGNNVTIYQNVTIGRKKMDSDEYPIIGDNVTIYANTCIIGNITIGSNAVIGCNSVVLRDVQENEIVYGTIK